MDSGIVPHQTATQERFILDIIASGSLDASDGIAKATATKKSGNWYRRCTFFKHSGIADEFLGGIPQEKRTILVLSFFASLRRNQFVTTRKQILLHRTVKSAIIDVLAYVWEHLSSDPDLESSGQTALLLQQQLRGYKTLEPTTKHQKATPSKLVPHIYKRTNTHLNTAIGRLIANEFFFCMLRHA